MSGRLVIVTARGNMYPGWASTAAVGTCSSRGEVTTRHVHVYRDGRLVVKWDLDNRVAMKGAATRRILELIAELEAEGLL